MCFISRIKTTPQKLVRSDHASWAFSDVTFGPTIASPTGVGGSATTPNTDSANSGNAYFPQPATYVVTAYNEDTGQESRASSSVTLTNDLGLKRNYNSVSWAPSRERPAIVSTRPRTASSTATSGRPRLTFPRRQHRPDLSQGPPIGDNPFNVAGNYPKRIAFHEQRSFWACSINRPNGVWASRSADYENMDFTRPTREDDAFAIGLVATKVNVVNNLVSTKQGLLALTSHNIFSIQGSNEDYITAAPPPRVRPEVSRGVSELKPIVVDNVTFYETSKDRRGPDHRLRVRARRDQDRRPHHFLASPVRKSGHHLVGLMPRKRLRRSGPFEAMGSCSASPGIRRSRCGAGRSVRPMAWSRTCARHRARRGPALLPRSSGDQRIFEALRRAHGVGTVGGSDRRLLSRLRAHVHQRPPISELDRLDHLEGREVVAYIDGSVVSQIDSDPLIVTDGNLTPSGCWQEDHGRPALLQRPSKRFRWRCRPAAAGMSRVRSRPGRSFFAWSTPATSSGAERSQPVRVKQRENEAYGDPLDLKTGDFESEHGRHFRQ
jgi:hypothetical protein